MLVCLATRSSEPNCVTQAYKTSHLESYTPGQDQAKSYVPVCTGMYLYVQVYASTGILVQYVLVCTAMYQKHDMNVSHTYRQLFESKLKQRTAPMQEIC